jgi:hypothetical protein
LLELKTLVSLHQNGGIGELTEDEVTITSAVLELRDKPVSAVMTPLEDVFTLSADHILDENTIDEVLCRFLTFWLLLLVVVLAPFTKPPSFRSSQLATLVFPSIARRMSRPISLACY